MTQSPRHKAIPLDDLEWLVMPAILLKQFRMFYKGEQPVGVAVWALADDLETDRRRRPAADGSGMEERRDHADRRGGGAVRGEAEMREQIISA